MIENEILDEPVQPELNPDRWKFAFFAIAFLAVSFFVNSWIREQTYILATIIETLVIGVALYFFIKKVGYEYFEVTQLFSWGTLIVFGGFLISNTIKYLMDDLSFINSISSFAMYNLGTLIRSMLLGYLLALGVFHLIKNKNWWMPVLMAILSWMLMTIFTF